MIVVAAVGVAAAAGKVVAAWIWSVVVFTVVSFASTLQIIRSWNKSLPPREWPPIWVLRPCEGDEPGLRENLASSLCAYPGACRVLFLVPSVSDASFAIASDVARQANERANAQADPLRGPPAQAEVVITEIASSTRNRKSAHLSVGLERAVAARAARDPGAPEVIVQVDSDVRLDDRSLPALVGALGDDPKIAASFAAPIELGALTVGDAASSGLLSASTQDFLVLAGLAQLTHGVLALSGACAAHRVGPLVETGGFSSLEGLLGEDFEVGRRLHERGLGIAISREPARCVDEGRSFSAVLSRTARWQMVVRQQRPGLIGTYPLFLAATPLALLLASVAALLGGGLLALQFAALLVVLRVALAMWLRRLHRAPVGVWRGLILDGAAEVLMLLATIRALRGRDVVWRGRRLRIGKGGVIES